jgi:hypothetical protein
MADKNRDVVSEIYQQAASLSVLTSIPVQLETSAVGQSS